MPQEPLSLLRHGSSGCTPACTRNRRKEAGYFVAKGTNASLSLKGDAMTFMKRLEPLWLFLVIVGCLNWAVLAIWDTNVLSKIFGSGTATDVVYCVIGFAALMFIPKLMEDMHLTDRMRHSH